MARLRPDKRRTPSSRAWLERQINDPYVARAKREGYRSRAAFKLAEIDDKFHLLKKDARVVDLGAAPGGWSWAIARLGARVLSVDKADLDPRVTALSGVMHRRDSAFALDPSAEAPFDWLFSDVIAYPPRLFALVRKWIEAGGARRIVCTIKFQGATDHAAADAFAAIPGGRVMHLFHNKHELTFVWRQPQ
jgi:23S rRNA (cytidine2498-2'-O)-methyltransferase